MNIKKHIDANWREFRDAIDDTYASVGSLPDGSQERDDAACLRDYAENVSWSDSLARLLARETENEREHRRNRPSVPGFSAETAAKLILMIQAANGNTKPMPRATCFLVFRQTAIEAQVLGNICGTRLTAAWRAAVNSLDYSDLMKKGAA